MKSFFIKSTILVNIVSALLLVFTNYCFAVEEIDGKFYFKLNSLTVSVGNKFDGELSYNSDSVTYNVPKLTDGDGFGIVIGELRDHWAGELYYSNSQHQGNHDINTYDCNYEELGLNFKYYILTPESSFNIFALAGAGLSKINVTNGASKSPTTDDSSFSGLSYNYGFGIILKVAKSLTLEGTYFQNQFEVDEIKGLGVTLKPQPSLSAPIKIVQLSLVFGL